MTLMAVLSLFAACQKGGRQSDQAESAGDSRWDWQGAELEYRQIQAELNLARTVKPYLVLDFRKREIEIRLKGADVWNNPMETVDGDYGVIGLRSISKGLGIEEAGTSRFDMSELAQTNASIEEQPQTGPRTGCRS